jgi:hypothetical protein
VLTGVEFMHKLPDVRVDPGYESFLQAVDWSMDRVFSDAQKVNYGVQANAETKAVWATLAEWHNAHQLASDVSMGQLPVTFTEPHMRGKQLGTGMRRWPKMWQTLLRFATRPPPLQAGPAGPAPVRATPAPAPPVPGPGRPAAPRSSQVNVVNHLGYGEHEATVAQMLDRGEAYVTSALAEEGGLFWIELDHGEGELSVGLGRRSDAPEGEPELEGDAEEMDRLWVLWYVRKSSRHLWGKGAVQFKEHIAGYDARRRPVLSITREHREHLLPVVVELCNGCSEMMSQR